MPIPNRPDERIVVILNPASGGSDDFRARIERALHEGEADHEIRETSTGRDGMALARGAREERVRSVMVGGGDGTVMAVINGLGGN